MARQGCLKKPGEDVKGLLTALQFLTIIPVRQDKHPSDEELGRSMAFFPTIGLLIGLLLVIMNLVLTKYLPEGVLNVLLLITLTITTGAIHLDGLADTIDGIAGGRNREESLAIMKEGRIGALGSVGLIFLILLKYISLSSIPTGLKNQALIAMSITGRWSMVPMAFFSNYARKENGTGRPFVNFVTAIHLIAATIMALLINMLLFYIKGIVILLLIGMITFMATRFFKQRLGGVTGDVLGATNEVNEVLCLFLIAALGDFL